MIAHLMGELWNVLFEYFEKDGYELYLDSGGTFKSYSMVFGTAVQSGMNLITRYRWTMVCDQNAGLRCCKVFRWLSAERDILWDIFVLPNNFVSLKRSLFYCKAIDSTHKSQNAAVPYPTMQYFVTEMCTCVHISVTNCCIVGYGTAAFWDLWDGSIVLCLLHIA